MYYLRQVFWSNASSAITADAQDVFSNESCLDLQSFVIDAFTGDEVLRDDLLRTLWSPIVNSAYFDAEKINKDSGVARKLSSLKLPVEYRVSDEETVWSARERDKIYVGVSSIESILMLKNLKDGHIYKTSGLFLLKERYGARQNGHNDVSVRARESPGYFMIITGSEVLYCFVCDSSRIFCILKKGKRKCVIVWDLSRHAWVHDPSQLHFNFTWKCPTCKSWMEWIPFATVPCLLDTPDVLSAQRNYILIRLEYCCWCRKCHGNCNGYCKRGRAEFYKGIQWMEWFQQKWLESKW